MSRPNNAINQKKDYDEKNQLNRKKIGDPTRKKMLEAAKTEYDIIDFEWKTGNVAKQEAERLGVSLSVNVSKDKLTGGLL